MDTTVAIWRYWNRRWANLAVFLLSTLCCFNFYLLVKILSQNQIKESRVLGDRIAKTPTDLTQDGEVNFIPETSMCSYRTRVDFNHKQVQLDLPPFDTVTSNMKCLLNGIVAVFGQEFAALNGAILNPSKINISTSVSAKGGEKIEDAWNQPEDIEYISPLPGYFTVPCEFPPVLNFDETDFKFKWAECLRCHAHGVETNLTISKDPTKNSTMTDDYIPGLTIAVTRYEYANFYHAMTDLYNAFVLKLLLSTKGERVNILFVDAHPEGRLDIVWSNLFGKVIRAGRLKQPTKFDKLVWGIQGYRSPLNQHHSISVPYLEEFRRFFLTSHGVNAEFYNHVIDCRRLTTLVIWRHDHVTHPRNKMGKVVRKFSNEDEILRTVKDTLDTILPTGLGQNNTVLGATLESLAMKDQLDLISKCDILVGMHGAGLSHGLFLPPSSGLVELLPSYSSPDLIHFQAMTSWRKIAYERWHNVEWKMDKDRTETYVRPGVVRKLLKSIYSRICSGA